MTDVKLSLKRISWRDVAPWLLLTQTFRLALSTPLVTLALAGVIATSVGWRIAGGIFLPSNLDSTPEFEELAFHHHVLSRWPGGQGPPVGVPALLNLAHVERAPIDPILDIPARMVTPFWQVLQPDIRWGEFFYFLTGGCLSIAIWALFGGAITRIAVVRFGLEERVGLREATQFALTKWPSYAAAPLLPLLGIAMCAAPAVVLGVLMRFNLGVIVAAIVWPLALLFGSAMAVLALGLCLGWPLMWGTISAENSDAFDAISRSYAYTFQKPLQYLFYVMVVGVIGLLGWFVTWAFVEMLITLCRTGAAWGATSARMASIQQIVDSTTTDTSRSLALGFGLVQFFEGIVRSIGSAVSYSYFWCSTAAIYLLLRYDADRTEMDDVVLDDDPDLTLGLPPLQHDAAGVAGTPDESPAAPPTEKSSIETASDSASEPT